MSISRKGKTKEQEEREGETRLMFNLDIFQGNSFENCDRPTFG